MNIGSSAHEHRFIFEIAQTPIKGRLSVAAPVFRNGVTQIAGQGFTPIASSSFVTSSS